MYYYSPQGNPVMCYTFSHYLELYYIKTPSLSFPLPLLTITLDIKTFFASFSSFILILCTYQLSNLWFALSNSHLSQQNIFLFLAFIILSLLFTPQKPLMTFYSLYLNSYFRQYLMPTSHICTEQNCNNLLSNNFKLTIDKFFRVSLISKTTQHSLTLHRTMIISLNSPKSTICVLMYVNTVL